MRVTLWGRAAARALAPGRRGRVIAVFERSLYVETDAGIACLGAPSIGPGPLNALLDRPVHAFLGEIIDCRADGLQIGRTRLASADAAAWRAPVPSTVMPGLDPGISSRLCEMAGSTPAMTMKGAEGFALLVLPLLTGGLCSEAGDPLHAAALPGLRALRAWIAAAGSEPDSAMAGLLGLGPGLTPSGDDVLGGAMIALRVFGRADMADHLAAWVRPRAGAATSAISAAHLACAAEGEGAEAFHRVLLALGGEGELGPALEALNRLGHSSGWDMLAGAALVLGALADRSSGSFRAAPRFASGLWARRTRP